MADQRENNFFVVQGDTFGPKTVTYGTGVAGSPASGVIDLTGVTISGDIRKEFDQDVIASFTITPVDLSIGKFQFSIPSTVTAALPVEGKMSTFVYDLQINWGGSPETIETILYGLLKVRRESTRAA